LTSEETEMGRVLTEAERSRERNKIIANIGLPLSQPFLEQYVARLPKNYRLPKEGIRIMDEAGAQLLVNQSPTRATRSKRREINEIAKRYTAVGATFEDAPSQYLVQRRKKGKQCW
jgi:hypothetical protein